MSELLVELMYRDCPQRYVLGFDPAADGTFTVAACELGSGRVRMLQHRATADFTPPRVELCETMQVAGYQEWPRG